MISYISAQVCFWAQIYSNPERWCERRSEMRFTNFVGKISHFTGMHDRTSWKLCKPQLYFPAHIHTQIHTRHCGSQGKKCARGKMLLWCNQQQCSKTNLVNKKIILVEGSESCLVGLIKYKVLLSTCNLVLGSRCYLGYVSCRKPPYVTWWSQNHVI